jgi:unsaturated rhamnogalacturonyl hydrolase
VENKNLIKKIADRVIFGGDTDWNMDINQFDWVPGVGLHGIFNAWQETGEQKYLNFLTKWTDSFLPAAYTQKTVNSTAPLLTVLDLYLENKECKENKEYLKTCLDIAEYIINGAPLTREGGLEHTVTEAVAALKEQIWADTLFMVCIFLAKLGKVSDIKYTDFAVNQLKIHLDLLSAENGLFYHGWNCETKDHLSGIFWGRANAWIVYSSMEIINTADDFDGKDKVIDHIRKHIEVLAKYQRGDGSFGTIIDDPGSYSETSATAGIAAGIKKAVTAGIADEKYLKTAEKAVDFIKTMIKDDGSVMGVSTGTPIMKDAEAYKTIPASSPTLYGQALSICALKLY